MKIHILSVLLVTTSQLHGQSEYQLLYPVSTLGTQYPQQVQACPDGSAMVQLLTDSGLVFERFDPAGEPLWAFSYFTDAGPLLAGRPPMAVTPDGGALIICPSETDALFNTQEFDLVRIDAGGVPQWTKRFLVVDSSALMSGVTASISCAADGHFFVTMTSSLTSSISKLSSAGSILWTKRIMDIDIFSGLEWVQATRPLADGGCVFIGGGMMAPTGAFALGRLDAAGNALWMRSVSYDAPIIYMETPTLMTGPAGELIVTSRLDLVGSSFNVAVFRFDANGDPLFSDLYVVGDPVFAYMIEPAIMAGGELFIGGGSYPTEKAFGFWLQADGSVTSSFVTSTAYAGAQISEVYHFFVNAIEDTLVLGCDLVQRDTIFGTEERTPALWKSITGSSGACFTGPVTVDRYEVPAGIVSVSDLGSATPTTLSVSPATASAIARPLPASSSFCGVVTTPEAHRSPSLLVFPNPYHSGDEMIVDVNDPGVLEVVDATGRQIHKSNVTKPGRSRQWITCASGILLVRFVPSSGAPPMTARLVVE